MFIHVGTRKVFLSSSTYHPNEKWVVQQASVIGRIFLYRVLLQMAGYSSSLAADLTQLESDELIRERYRGIRRIRTPLLAPDANAFAES